MMKYLRWTIAAVLVLLFTAGLPLAASAEELEERVGALESALEKLTKGPGIAVGDWRFIPFGYVKVDAVYDDSRAFNGNFIAWVLQETDNPTNLAAQATPGDDEFSLTANQSRFDLKIIAPKYGDVETYGLFEIDFYGGLIDRQNPITIQGGPENRPQVLVRHAFIEMKKGTWGLLLGQTHDPISLQVADTWNYFVCWMAGNPGYRRPQIRFMKDVPLPDGSKIALWAGVMRTVEDIGWVHAGEDTGWPTTFARITYHKPLLGKELMFSVNGHYGHEDVQLVDAAGKNPAGQPGREISSWSGNVELIVPLPYGLWIKGEAFVGRTLGTHFAGIGQSFNPDTLKGIRAYGGWGQLGWIASPKLRFHVGGSVDNPLNEDLITSTASANRFNANRSLNRLFFANFMYNLTPAVLTGYEITHALTQYSDGAGNGDDLRHQVSFMFKF